MQPLLPIKKGACGAERALFTSVIIRIGRCVYLAIFQHICSLGATDSRCKEIKVSPASPAKQDKSVVLPQPEGPSTASGLPACTIPFILHEGSTDIEIWLKDHHLGDPLKVNHQATSL